jgi:hypothetical protein
MSYLYHTNAVFYILLQSSEGCGDTNDEESRGKFKPCENLALRYCKTENCTAIYTSLKSLQNEAQSFTTQPEFQDSGTFQASLS